MAAPPGSAGLPLIGDKSVSYYRDPISFVQKRIDQYESRIFITRLVNVSTAIVASWSSAKTLLQDNASKTHMGYKAFLYHVFGDNMLFSDGEEALAMRRIMIDLFKDETINKYREKISDIIDCAVSSIKCDESMCIYKFFKKLTTELCLSLFLGIDFKESQSLAEKIVELTIKHWHGLISVPVNFKVFSSSSTFTKAIDAKEKLIAIIKEILAKEPNGISFPHQLSESGFPTRESVHAHILLFTCAIVPKALASLLTSFVLGTSSQSRNPKEVQTRAATEPEFLDALLLETGRLWPPLVGGRKDVIEDINIEGYCIPKGYAAVYATYSIHRDPKIYKDADTFFPERWLNENKNDREKLLVFGFGPRKCIGQKFVWDFLTETTKKLSKNYNWEVTPDQDLSYKWLPVARPRNPVMVVFTNVDVT